MELGELIAFLEEEDQGLTVDVGFHNPHSYRGYYDELAFEPTRNITVAEMLACAKSALGTTYHGWKGGEYEMLEYTRIWLAHKGQSGEGISTLLLYYMFGKPEEYAMDDSDE